MVKFKKKLIGTRPNKYEFIEVVKEHPKLKEKITEVPKEVINLESLKSKKLEDIKKDLADDGKRNYSHDSRRKSPGRKKKKLIDILKKRK